MYKYCLTNFCRKITFYGQTLKSFLQKEGETLYMPNLIYHSVWNMSPTLSVGNNLLFQSSFVEQIGSGTPLITEKLIKLGQSNLKNISVQINTEIRTHSLPKYKPPKFSTKYDNSCIDERFYNWSLLKKNLKKKRFSKKHWNSMMKTIQM